MQSSFVQPEEPPCSTSASMPLKRYPRRPSGTDFGRAADDWHLIRSTEGQPSSPKIHVCSFIPERPLLYKQCSPVQALHHAAAARTGLRECRQGRGASCLHDPAQAHVVGKRERFGPGCGRDIRRRKPGAEFCPVGGQRQQGIGQGLSTPGKSRPHDAGAQVPVHGTPVAQPLVGRKTPSPQAA